MKNGRNPFHKTQTGPWGFWAGSMGEISGSQNEKWQGPPSKGKRRRKKEKEEEGEGKKGKGKKGKRTKEKGGN